MDLLFDKEQNKFRLFTKVLSSFLAFLMVFSTGIISCYAMGAGVPEKLELENMLSEYIEDIIDLNGVKSINTEKTEDNELYLDMKDNSTVVYTFSEPVTYIDDNGNLRCKDNSIVEQKNKENKKDGYDYSNGQNDYRINFSSDSSKGVLVEYNDVSFSLAPISDVSAKGYETKGDSKERTSKSFEYVGLYGDNSLLKYYPQINGVKEEIILDENINTNIFESTLVTKGCSPVLNKDGSVSLINDKTNEEVQNFIAPFAYDSQYVAGIADEHFCSDCRYEIKKVSDNKYVLSVKVSDKWLNSDTTVYPVTIDPTTSEIYNYADASVYSEMSSINFGSEQICSLGYDDEYGYGRIYTKFTVPSDIKKYATIQSAEMWESELTGSTSPISVTPYIVTDSWTENGIKWDNMPEYDTESAMDTKTIDGNSADDPYDSNMYSFNIKSAVERWTNGTANYGIVFISDSEQTNQQNWKTFAAKNYISSDYRPFTVIKYANDTRAPKILSVTGNPTEWTNKDVILTVDATDEIYSVVSGIASYSFATNDSTFTAQMENTKAISNNGTYYVRARDNAGNTSTSVVVTIDKIDQEKPTAPIVTGLPASRVKEDIILTAESTDEISGIEAYSFSNESGVYDWQNENTKAISENGIYYVCSKDKAGNISTEVTINVNKIDKTKPSAPIITGNATEWTNEDVVLTATPTDENTDIVEYSFSTSQHYYSWQTSPYKAFSYNCTVYTSFKDSNGDISAADPVVIDKIDKDAPTTPIVVAEYEEDTVILTATSADSISGLSEYSFSNQEGVYNWQKESTKEFNENTYIYVYARDIAGNVSEVKEKKVFIGDHTAPTFIDVTGNVTEWTDDNVVLTVNGAVDTESGLHEMAYSFSDSEDEFDWQASNSKSFYSNQTVYIYIRDDAGNIEYVDSVIIDKIDKDGPVIEDILENNENGMTTLTIKAIDSQSGIAAYKMGSGDWTKENSFSFEIDKYNYISLYVKDNLGNITSRHYNFYYPACYTTGGSYIYLYNPNPNCKSTIYYRTSKGLFTKWQKYTGGFSTSKKTIYVTFTEPSSMYNLSAPGEISVDVSKIPTVSNTSYTVGKYEESTSDMTINYKDVSFNLLRTYDNYYNTWFLSINSKLTLTVGNRIFAVLPDNTQHTFFPKTKDTYYDSYSNSIIKVKKDGSGKIIMYTINFYGTYYNYDENGNLASVSNNKGDEITFERNYYSIVITDGAGKKYELSLDENKNLTSIKDPAGGTITYNYNSNNKLVSVVDQAGVILDTYRYNNNGRVSKHNDASFIYDSYRIARKVYDSGAYINYTYDGYKVTATNSNGETSVVTYDYKGRIIYKENCDGTTITNTYDDYGYTSKEISRDGSSIVYRYSSVNKLLSKVSDNGDVIRRTYDSYGNCTYEEIIEGTEKNYKYYVYDSNNQVVLFATLKDDYEGTIPKQYIESKDCFNTVEYTYSNGVLISEIDNTTNAVKTYEYDDYGHISKITEVKMEDGKEITKVINSEYDIMGNLLELSGENTYSNYIYDAAGRILFKNENGQCTRILYDKYGRIIQKIDPEDYDASKDGLPEKNTYADSKAGHTYVYNTDTGNLESETNRFGKTITYSYNEIGNKTGEAFDLYKLNYSNHGELINIQIDGVKVVEYDYDENYKLLSKTFANDDVIRYEYYDNGNIKAQYHDDDSIPYLEYSYNENNKLAEKINNDTGLRYSYCESGYVSVYRLSDDTLIQSYQKEETDSGISIYENHFGSYYTSAFNDTSVSFQTNGDTVNYTYAFDDSNKIKSAILEDNGKEILKINYNYFDDIGLNKQYTYKSGESTYTTDFSEFYDEKGRISFQVAGKNQSHYTYDSTGRLLRVDNNLLENSYSVLYSYDDRGNLTSKSLYDYTTDELKDLTPNEIIDFTYSNTDCLDQLVEVNGDELMYDAIGNLIYYGNIEFVWNDGRNLECVIDEDNGYEYNYTYDENGIRTSKTINDETTYFNTKNGVVIAQTDDTNTMYFQYDANGVPVGFICNGIQYFYLTNLSGDVLGITDADGNLIVCYLYDEWGKLITIDAVDEESYNIATLNPLRYRGYYYDNETGYYCIGSRYYNPEICRFINSDNYEILSSTKDNGPVNNLFTYFENDPINNTEFLNPYFEKKN